MPSKTFALAGGKPRQLQLSWRGAWKGAFDEVTVRVDGSIVGVVSDRAALERGRTFVLLDGSELSLKLRVGLLNTEVEVLHDGLPVPGSSTDPRTRIRVVGRTLLLVAATAIIVGFYALLVPDPQVRAVAGPGGAVMFVVAALYGTLAYFIMRESTWALLATLLLFVGDAIMSLVETSAGADLGAGLVLRVLLIVLTARGLSASRVIRRQRRLSVRPA